MVVTQRMHTLAKAQADGPYQKRLWEQLLASVETIISALPGKTAQPCEKTLDAPNAQSACRTWSMRILLGYFAEACINSVASYGCGSGSVSMV